MAREISDEERQRRRELAQRLHAEGRFGGPQPGSGRPRKPRASQIIAEEVAKKAEELKQGLFTLAEEGRGELKLKAIVKLLEIEDKERQIADAERADFENMKRDELMEQVMALLERARGKGLVPDLTLADEDVEEVEQYELSA